MAGQIIFEPTTTHVHSCEHDLPAKEFRPGTIWECDECCKRWVAVGKDGIKSEFWRELTDRNRGGLDL